MENGSKERQEFITCFISGIDHLFFYRGGGGYLFHKKNVCKLWLAEKNCLLQGYELKKIVCKAKGDFLEYIDISKF